MQLSAIFITIKHSTFELTEPITASNYITLKPLTQLGWYRSMTVLKVFAKWFLFRSGTIKSVSAYRENCNCVCHRRIHRTIMDHHSMLMWTKVKIFLLLLLTTEYTVRFERNDIKVIKISVVKIVLLHA